jgi:hypothetical protein
MADGDRQHGEHAQHGNCVAEPRDQHPHGRAGGVASAPAGESVELYGTRTGTGDDEHGTRQEVCRGGRVRQWCGRGEAPPMNRRPGRRQLRIPWRLLAGNEGVEPGREWVLPPRSVFSLAGSPRRLLRDASAQHDPPWSTEGAPIGTLASDPVPGRTRIMRERCFNSRCRYRDPPSFGGKEPGGASSSSRTICRQRNPMPRITTSTLGQIHEAARLGTWHINPAAVCGREPGIGGTKGGAPPERRRYHRPELCAQSCSMKMQSSGRCARQGPVCMLEADRRLA